MKEPVTLQQTFAKYFECFTSHPGSSKYTLLDMLKLQHKILPDDNLLPNAYQSIYRMINSFLVKLVVFHALYFIS